MRFVGSEIMVIVKKKLNSLLPNKHKIPHFQFQEFTCAFMFVIVNITNYFLLKFDKSRTLEMTIKFKQTLKWNHKSQASGFTAKFKHLDVISMVDMSKEYAKLSSILLLTIGSFSRSCSLKFFSENHARKTKKYKLPCQHVFFL